jgi:hypothetical protein
MARDEIYDAMKTRSKEKFNRDRTSFMAEAITQDDGGWTVHTEFHWSRIVAGKKLDFWPSRKKFQYAGKVHRGDVYAFIKSKTQSKKGSS